MSAPARRSKTLSAAGLVVLGLVLLHVGLAWTSAERKSPTFDEGFHLTSGYANWLGGDFRLHSGNGLLAQTWFALPLVALPGETRFPSPDAIIETQRVRDFHELTVYLAHVFFYEVGNDLREILRRGRAMAMLLGAALCAGVFLWSRRLFGTGPALLSCALCALSPNVLAHARLTTSDLLFTVALLGALALAWRSFWRPGLPAVLAAGVALGALALTKLSSLGALPMIALLVAARAAWPEPLVLSGVLAGARPTRRGRTLRLEGVAARGLALGGLVLLEGLVAVAVVWGAYGLRFDAVPPSRAGRDAYDGQWRWALERDSAVLDGIDLLRRHRLLPEAYLFGAAFVWRQADERRTFFAGASASGGDWRFFPAALAVKTPLGLLALLAIAAGRAVAATVALHARAPGAARAPPARLLRDGLPLLVIALVHGGFALAADINLGLRHVLPLYPVAFVAAGGAAVGLARAQLARRVAVALAGLGFAAASLAIWPHYLAFFNALVGPQHGYRVLVDSSLDWGQDLDAVGEVLARRRASGDAVYLSYFGTADPLFHGIDARRLPGFLDWPSLRSQWARVRTPLRLGPGLYAISATMLQQTWSRVPNPIDERSERRYASLRRRFAPLLAPDAPQQALDAVLADPQARGAWLELRELRLAQLCRALRQREPEGNVGYSVLLYEVGADELARALEPQVGLSPRSAPPTAPPSPRAR